MTTTRISICLLALFLVASYASATTIQELCKGTFDPKYCLALFHKTGSPSTDFKSEELRKMLLNQVLSKGQVAQNFLADGLTKLKGAEAACLKTCDDSISLGVKQIKQGEYDPAGVNFDNCYDELDDAPEGASKTLGNIMVRLRKLADDAANACKMANDIAVDLNEKKPKAKA